MAIAPEPGKDEVPHMLKRDGAGGRDQGKGSDRAVSRLPGMWSSAQRTGWSVLVALRLVGPPTSRRALPAIRAEFRCA